MTFKCVKYRFLGVDGLDFGVYDFFEWLTSRFLFRVLDPWRSMAGPV